MWRCNWLGLPGMGNGPFGGGLFGLLLTVLLVVGLIYLLTLIVQRFSPKRDGGSDRHDSMNILRERFARGEISHEEYRRMRDILSP